MEVTFKGFDDGGWWLGVKGCQGGQRSPDPAKKLAENSQNWLGVLLPWGRERGERKWSLWIKL